MRIDSRFRDINVNSDLTFTERSERKRLRTKVDMLKKQYPNAEISLRRGKLLLNSAELKADIMQIMTLLHLLIHRFQLLEKNAVLCLQNVRSICVPGRLANIVLEIETYNIHVDILCLTETWYRPGEVLPDIGLTETNLRFVSYPSMGSNVYFRGRILH